MPQIFTTTEAAEYCTISYQEMVILLRRKAIPAIRKGVAFFVSQSDLDQWLELQKEQPKDKILTG